ncbi:Trafficking protein particle complex subunit 8 [Trichuris trichiura]|uniref:Trafficking protein particle complex subunit 8 n=1 Tax=Trichuris trichiura TaxID=36087 RepID=A0A077ZCM0_TRITR|nr:Trafficking protein particle complex subunit 8 [Trichuris trichiura]
MSSNSVTEMDDEQFLRLLSSPVVAVLASDEANEICRKNGLTFVDLLKPFEQLEDKGAFSYKDPNGQTVDVINLRIDFRDLRRDHFLSPSALRPALWDIMRASKVPQVPLDSSEQFETSSEPSSWFLNYRYHLLKHLEPGNHEFIRCYVGCLFVVSTSEQNPKERINRLVQQQHSLQHQTGKHEVYERSAEMYSMPKWFCPNIFKYYLLIHDPYTYCRAEQLFEEVKTSYGVNACHLLRINSLQASAVDVVPDYWSLMPPSLSSIAATFQEAPFSEVDDVDERKPACLPIDALGFSEENPFAGETIAHPLSEVNFRSVETEKATDAQLDMYGLNKAPARPGRCLTESDVARLKVFVNEFCTRGLVPYVERQLKFFNDVVSSRKGIGKSLLSATKKWLSGSSAPNLSSLVASSTAGSSGSTNGSDRPAGSPSGQGESIFASESWEMQGRRLADLAFLFQHYELAHQIYHMLRKELYAQQAWFNYAGACEMASLSGRLSGSRAYLGHYMDAAVSTYGDVCKTPWLAVRAALLSASLLCSSGHWIEAANQLVKVIDKDAVAGALFLEEAARCYYNVRMYRKAAFHLILAGNRFSKVPLRRHAVYAYERALRMYIGKQWKAAEAHIDLTLGQLYHSTKEHSAGVRTFERLFSLGASNVAVGQQRVAFSEYLTLLKLSNESKSRSDVPKLVLPKILDEQTVVYSCILPEEVGCYEESDQPACWASMEQSCASVAMAGNQFVPYACYRGQNWRATLPCKVPVNQTVMVKLHLSNPLNIPIGLTQARLLVTLSPHDDSEPKDDDVMVSSVDEYVLPAMASNALLVLTATPRKQGLLTIVGIAYCLCNVEEADSNGSVPLSNDCLWKFCQSSAVYGSQAMLVRGRRLNDTKEQRLGRFYATDTRLSMLVASEAPLLKFDLAYAAGKYFEDQIISAPIVVSNIGTLPVDRICICASSAANVAVTGASAASHPIGWKVVGGNVVYDVGGTINAGESINLTLWIRAVGGPTSAETNLLRVLFFWCCSTGAPSEVKYRTFRWRAAYTVVPSVKASIQYKPLPHTYLPDVPASRLLIVLSVLNWSQVCEMKLLAVGMQSTQGCRLQSLLSEARDYSLEPGQEETICCVSAKVSVRSDVGSFSCLPLSPVEAEKAQLDGNNFLRGVCRFPANAVSSKPVISLFWSTSMARSDGTVVTLFGETSLIVDASPFGGSLSGKDPASDCDVINYALLYSPSISHDFSASRICRIPVELKLYNGSESETARIKVECIDRAGNGQSANSNVRDLIWAGTYRSSVSLEPKGEATVHLIAAATDTSVIDLKSGLRIVVDRSPYGEPYELALQSHFITIHSLQAIGTVAEVK